MAPAPGYGQTWTNKAVLIQGNLFNGMNITPHGVVLRNTEACVVKANQFSAQTTAAINLAQVNKNYDIEPNAYSGYMNTLTSPPQQLPPPVNSVAGTAQPACFHTCGE